MGTGKMAQSISTCLQSPGFNSQCPHATAQPSMILVPESDTFFRIPQALGMLAHGTHTYTQGKHSYKRNNS